MASSAASVAPARAERAEPVAAGVYLIAGHGAEANPANAGRIANVSFIVGERDILVFNAGTSLEHGRAVLGAIRAVSDLPIRALVVGQPYQDRLFGAKAFTELGVPVWMHEASVDLMKRRCDQCLKNLKSLLGEAEMAGTVLPEVANTITTSQTIDLSGRPIRVIWPGWSSGPGDLALYDETTQTLFSGALSATRAIPDLRDAKLTGWRAALEQLSQLPISRVVPDIGAVGHRDDLLQCDRYLQQLETVVSRALRAGVGLADLNRHIDLAEFADWQGYPSVHRRNANRLYLELERALFDEATDPPRN